MRKVLLLFLMTIAVSLYPIKVNASVLTKEWGIEQGQSWWSSINWTHTTEVSDGYLTATLDEEGYGIMRKFTKDGELVWETENYYGLYYGGFEIYKDNIYVLVYDVRYGIYLYKYDMDGNYVDAVGIYTTSLDENPFIYAGELFLVDDYFTICYKVGNNYYTYPEFFFYVDANTFEYLGYDDADDLSDEEINNITDSSLDYLYMDDMEEIYEERGYNTVFYQTISDDKYKYFIGTLYSETEAIGIIVKTDMDYKIVSVVKSDKRNEVYYDAAMIGNGTFVVSTYTTEWDESYPNGMTSYIKVFNTNGKVIEKRNVSRDLGTPYTDVICLSDYDDAIVLQVIGGTNDNIKSYFLKYKKYFDIDKKVSDGGEVVINPNANAGETVTFNVAPKEGYTIKSIKITDMEGNVIEPNNNTFVMPASNVNIEVEFVPDLKNPKTGTGILRYLLTGMIILLVGTGLYKCLNKFYKLRKS